MDCIQCMGSQGAFGRNQLPGIPHCRCMIPCVCVCVCVCAPQTQTQTLAPKIERIAISRPHFACKCFQACVLLRIGHDAFASSSRSLQHCSQTWHMGVMMHSTLCVCTLFQPIMPAGVTNQCGLLPAFHKVLSVVPAGQCPTGYISL